MVLQRIPTFDEVKDWANGNLVTSVNGESGDISIQSSSPPIYGDGSDGTITRSANGDESGIIYADSYTLEEGVTRTATGPVTIIAAREEIVISGTLDASAVGAPGGSGGSGGAAVSPDTDTDGNDGQPGDDGTQGLWYGSPSSGGGGGSGGTDDQTGGNGAAGGGSPGPEKSTTRPLYTPLSPYYNPVWELSAFAGSGGGGGGGSGSVGGDSYNSNPNPGNPGGDGGDGGGVVLLIAPTIAIDGTVMATGGAGGTGGDGPSNTYGGGAAGGGGGGAGGDGGLIAVFAEEVTDDLATYDVSGGPGGSGGSGGDGGAGTSGGDGESGEDGSPGDVLEIVGL